jgi:hypothetical protein
MRHSLGRTYPADIQNSIQALGRSLDDLMASTLELAMRADVDVGGLVRGLNARLVNDVIIVSDQLSDDEARQRLFAIQKEIFAIQQLFAQSGVPIQGRVPVATVEEEAVIPRAQAEKLLSDWRAAFDLYPSVVERYGRIRPSVEMLTALPIAGGAVAGMLGQFDARIRALDDDIFFVRDAFQDFEALLGQEGGAVRLRRPTFDRMRNWVAGVSAADEALKRLEGIGEKKPAERPAAPGIPFWAVIAVGGAALVGLIIFAATTGD